MVSAGKAECHLIFVTSKYDDCFKEVLIVYSHLLLLSPDKIIP